MTKRELTPEGVNALLEEEEVVSVTATGVGVRLILANGQYIDAVSTHVGMSYCLEGHGEDVDQQ